MKLLIKYKYEALFSLITLFTPLLIWLCTDHYFGIKNVQVSSSMGVQVLATVSGLFFTAYTLFIGLGVSSSKLDTEDTINSLIKEGASREEAKAYVKKEALDPIEAELKKATDNFKSTLIIMISILGFTYLVNIFVTITEPLHLTIGSRMDSLINLYLVFIPVTGAVYALYLIIDSAIFLSKIRRMIK